MGAAAGVAAGAVGGAVIAEALGTSSLSSFLFLGGPCYPEYKTIHRQMTNHANNSPRCRF